MDNNMYKISFASKDVRNFNIIFSEFLRSMATVKADENIEGSMFSVLPDFKIQCNKEMIIIWLPSCPESFLMLAEFVKEVDNFKMTYIADKGDKEVIETQKKSSEEVIGTEENAEPEQVVEPEEVAEPKQVVESEEVAEPEDSEPAEVENRKAEEEAIPEISESPKVEEETPTEIKNDEVSVPVKKERKQRASRKGSKQGMVKEYILTLSDKFTVGELKLIFAGRVDSQSINSTLVYLKKAGKIKSVGYGEYIVVNQD